MPAENGTITRACISNIYVDGTLEGTGHDLNKSITFSAYRPYTIGAVSVGSTQEGGYWNGTIGIVNVYEKALSVDEVISDLEASAAKYG
ncbi:MAG: hypothetical protein HY364_04270 [Candidatus Aenigmarchaeota archaeon]|nr:hypothetical protein [Candidatus Aenigmarchaeota archaeon]